jgi:capsular exopolysaccharide synthesis family protein
MSEFFKALGQADRDRAVREQVRGRQTAPGTQPPSPVEMAVAAPVERPASVFLRPPLGGRPQPGVVEPPEPVDLGPEELNGHLVSLVTPATFEAEQYRALRHMIEELHVSSRLSMVAVSSPSVGDGKTTTAINLAGALAQSAETRVLLIDADLRRPAVADRLGLRATAPSPGLVGALVDRTLTLASVVRRRPPFNLDVLTAGDIPAAPYELLRSVRLGELLKEARLQYDYVIVDTPPLVAVPDCRVLANFVDGFVIVVAAHRTPKRLVEDALNVVEPSKMIGLLFNRDDRPLSGYYTSAYGRYTNGNGNGHRKWPWKRR